MFREEKHIEKHDIERRLADIVIGVDSERIGDSMRLKKIDAMHHFYGYDHLDRKCADCDHLLRGEYHGRVYYKCTVYGLSHSEATDWRKNYPACGLVDHDFPEHDNRVIDILKSKPIREEEPIPGQISVFEI